MIDKNLLKANYEKNSILQGYNKRKLKIGFLLDRFLKLIFPSKPERPIPPKFNNILVIQSHLIGDLIMATPLLNALRKSYPNAKIILLANKFADDLIKGATFVDEIITMNFLWSTYDYSFKNIKDFIKKILQLRKRKIEIAIDAQIDIRNAMLMFLIGAKRRLGYALTGGSSFLTDNPEFPKDISNLLEARLSVLRCLGIECEDKNTFLPLNQDCLNFVDTFLLKKNIDRDKLIGIHPGASKKEKLWSAKKFADIIQYLQLKGFHIVLIMGPHDDEIIKEIQQEVGKALLIFKSSLSYVVAFISRCKLLICLDSASVHIASAVGTHSIALYGPMMPWLSKPFTSGIDIIWNEMLDCRPCEWGKCKYQTNICMESINPEQVIEMLKKKLSIN